MKEALTAMRAELGEDSVIVASEKLKDGSVLLRAGVEETRAPTPVEQENPQGPPAAETGGSPFPGFDARYRESLLARLREPAAAASNRTIPFDAARLFATLRAHRTPDTIAKTVVERARKSGHPDMILALASGLDESMASTPSGAADAGAVLLAGPPGAGKTAVAAKLAAQHCLAGSQVRLAATDVDTAGQAARLESLAACLDVPVLRTPERASLAAAVKNAHSEGAALIADSAGCDPRGPLPRELLELLSAPGMNLIGVVSASADAEEAGEIAAALAKLGAGALIVTGLDLARRKGALVTLALSGLPIAQVTSSAYLAHGLGTLSPMELSRMLVADGPIP